VLAVALGVAVVIAIELAGQAAVGSFQSSLETLLGKTDLQITANGGVDEVWVARLASCRATCASLRRSRRKRSSKAPARSSCMASTCWAPDPRHRARSLPASE
jgi:hypothetical protein